MQKVKFLVGALALASLSQACAGDGGPASGGKTVVQAGAPAEERENLPTPIQQGSVSPDGVRTDAVDSLGLSEDLVTSASASAKTPTPAASTDSPPRKPAAGPSPDPRGRREAPTTTPTPSQGARETPTPASANAPAGTASPGASSPAQAPAEREAAAPSHAAFSSLLSRYVSATGMVDYAGLKSDRAKLDAYLATLAKATPTDSWTKDERLAYWINAYNAATLQLIVDNYPLTSIQKLDGGKPWDVKRIRLGGQAYSLNQIENEIIRPQFREPRIHFAVNCAAKGCPPLRDEAYTAARLDAQLAEQTRRFINNPAYTSLQGKTLQVSRIFDWYGEDFGSVPAFIGKYREVPAGATVEFREYDWALNKQ